MKHCILQLLSNTNFRFISKLPVTFKSVSFWITECNKLTVLWKHSQIRAGVKQINSLRAPLSLWSFASITKWSYSFYQHHHSALNIASYCNWEVVFPLYMSRQSDDQIIVPPDSSTYWEQLTFPIRDSQSINHCPPTQKWLSSKCGLQIRESNLSADNQAAKVLFPYPGRLMKDFRVSKKLYSLVRMEGVV